VEAGNGLPGLPALVRRLHDDGISDLAGLIEKLDYLNDGTDRSLGVDAIWLSPIHPSPGLDVGYDVADYDAIDPIFGTLEDFGRLVAEAHRRGIRIVLDLVMNHTSSAHRWFQESRRDPSGPFGDWYLWRDGRRDRFGRLHPPNNWVSFFGGSAWTWDEMRGQFCMHTFLPEQPDVNWRNPELRAAMLAMVRGLLDQDVDGFRLDVFNSFFKHPTCRRTRADSLGGAHTIGRSISTTRTVLSWSTSSPSSVPSWIRIHSA
jgi:alpha-glucosidase